MGGGMGYAVAFALCTMSGLRLPYAVVSIRVVVSPSMAMLVVVSPSMAMCVVVSPSRSPRAAIILDVLT